MMPRLSHLLCALTAALPLSGASPAPRDVLADYKAAAHTMQTRFFDFETGSWPKAIDWTSAVLGTHLAAASATLTTTDPALADSYLSELLAFYYGQASESLKLQAYDDILWVVLNWLEAVQTIDHRVAVLPKGSWTGAEWRRTFAARSYDFYQIAHNGWDNDLCDGGMIWSPWLEPYKNAITNELYISASIGMFLHHPYPARNETYLWNAIRAHEWLTSSNMTDAGGLYTDGFHVSNLRAGGKQCDKRDEMVYTYNQGVLLSALRGLAEATNDEKYIVEGLQLIDAVLKSEGSVGELVFDGILTEKCDPGGYCSQNGQTFKGIFMHHLTTFCKPLTHASRLAPATKRSHRLSCARYQTFIRRAAHTALITRNEHGVMGSWWGIPAGLLTSTHSTHDTRPPGTSDFENMCVSSLQAHACEAAQRPSGTRWGDLNDRGRGRTVESHSGGLAALRALLVLNAQTNVKTRSMRAAEMWRDIGKSRWAAALEVMVVAAAALWMVTIVCWSAKAGEKAGEKGMGKGKGKGKEKEQQVEVEEVDEVGKGAYGTF